MQEKLIILINYKFKFINFIEDEFFNYVLGIGDWGLGPIPNPQSP